MPWLPVWFSLCRPGEYNQTNNAIFFNMKWGLRSKDALIAIFTVTFGFETGRTHDAGPLETSNCVRRRPILFR